jgi:hypothetical protein
MPTIKKKKKVVGKKVKPPTTIKDSSFIGVQFDKNAVESMNLIAEGLTQNATAFHTLAKVFATTGVVIESLITIKEGK